MIPPEVYIIVHYGSLAYIAKRFEHKQYLCDASIYADRLYADLVGRWNSKTGRKGHKPSVSVVQTYRSIV